MKKKGYTLIELIAVMAILSILLGCGFTMINTLNKIKKEVELEDAVYRVHSLLSYAKAYCRKNSYDGDIIIDTVGNRVIFEYMAINKKIVGQSEKLPSDIKIYAPTINNQIIGVSNMGYLENSGTIIIKSKDEQRKITTTIGDSSVNIKDKEVIDVIENN